MSVQQMGSSTTSVQKYTASQRSKSVDTTVCSSNSSCILKRRKPQNPLAAPMTRASCGSVIRQRVLSAKVLKLKGVQSQLNDANHHLSEALRENQILRNMQKRQDKALSKYEGTSADLPRLLNAHEEEIRTLNEKSRALRKTVRELNDQLKHKDEDLAMVQEQLKMLERLNKDRHLMERQKLTEIVEELQDKLQKAETEITLLNRKLAIETKNAKQRINSESVKYRQSQRELQAALEEIELLTSKLPNGTLNSLSADKTSHASKQCRRLPGAKTILNTQKHPTSDGIIAINSSDSSEAVNGRAHGTYNDSDSLNFDYQTDSVDSLKNRVTLDTQHKSGVQNQMLKHTSGVTEMQKMLDKLSFNGVVSRTSNKPTSKIGIKSQQTNPGTKNRHIKNTRISNLAKDDDNDEDIAHEQRQHLTNMRESVNNCKDVIEEHEKRLQCAKYDTDVLLDCYHKTEGAEKKLKKTSQSDSEDEFLKNYTDDAMTIDKIIKEELSFKRQGEDVTDQEEHQREKERLLATLRAIDREREQTSSDNDIDDTLQCNETGGYSTHRMQNNCNQSSTTTNVEILSEVTIN